MKRNQPYEGTCLRCVFMLNNSRDRGWYCTLKDVKRDCTDPLCDSYLPPESSVMEVLAAAQGQPIASNDLRIALNMLHSCNAETAEALSRG